MLRAEMANVGLKSSKAREMMNLNLTSMAPTTGLQNMKTSLHSSQSVVLSVSKLEYFP